MFRFLMMQNRWYGIKINSLENESQNIQDFIDSGDVVVLANDIEDFTDLMDIEADDITFVS